MYVNRVHPLAVAEFRHNVAAFLRSHPDLSRPVVKREFLKRVVLGSKEKEWNAGDEFHAESWVAEAQRVLDDLIPEG